MNLFTITFKNLRQRKARTALTILGVGVSIAAFVALTGLSKNLEDVMKETYKSRGTDLIILAAGTVDILSSSIDESYADEIRKMPEVEDLTPVFLDFYAVSLKDYLMVYGWKTGSYLFEDLDIAGRYPEGQDEVILGRMASKRLKKEIGDKIKIRGQLFTVTGIFQSKSLLEEGAAIISIKSLQELKRSGPKATAFNIKVRSAGSHMRLREEAPEMEYVRSKIENLYPDLEVKNVRTFITTNTPLFIVLNFTWAVSLVAFLIVILGIVNTVTTSVLERTREIGILIAIGWRSSRIIQLVLCEAALLGLMGGIAGILIGHVIMRVLVATPQLQGFMSMNYDGVFITATICVSAGLGVLSGIYPALKAISIEPIEVLKYEG